MCLFVFLIVESHLSDQSGFLAETRSQSVDLSQSFDEVTIEDLESYSEQFDSTALTPRTAEWSRYDVIVLLV